MWRRTTRILSLLACALALCMLPSTASAGSYWAELNTNRGEIAGGVNGFQWLAYGGPYDMYGSHCDARPGSYVAGSYCKLRWHTPAGLTAGNASTGGGILYGRYRAANTYFMHRTSRPGGNPDYNSDGTNHSAMVDIGHGWGALGAYMETGIRTTAATTPTSTTNWFDISTFTVLLNDPSVPVIANVSVAGAAANGWRGGGCHATNYAWADSGSQMWTANLVNLSTGAGVHSWQHATAMRVVVSGVPTASLNTCIPAPGTGSYVYRTTGWDMSGNAAVYDFTLSFDVTQPSVSVPTSAGTPVTDGRVFGSTVGYRPTFTWSIGDAHSGLASVVVRVDGQTVAHSQTGGTITMTPTTRLALGNRAVSITVTDVVGNSTTVTRTVSVRDDAKPTVTLAAPIANGENSPLLDITAADDHSGVDSASWQVRVNGVQMVVATGNQRLQANIGRLANGTHQIEVRISDLTGNQLIHTIQYVASSDTHTPPGMTGIYALDTPAVVDEGSAYHLVAIAVKDGRPIVTGRYEITKVGSPTVVAGKITTADGSVDMLVQDAIAGPMQLALTGSGLTPTTFNYTFRTKGTPDYCTTNPTEASCQATTGGGDSEGGNGTTGTGTTGTTGTGTGTTGGSSVSIGTSGGPGDKAPAKFTLKVVPTKKGVVLRTKQITFRFTSNERANYTVQPVGNRAATKVAMKKQTRVLRIKLTGSLLKRIQNAKTRHVTIKMRIVGIDGNKNITRKTVTRRIKR